MASSPGIMTLGLGLKEPWKIVDQNLDTNQESHELHIKISADRGSLFPCPICGRLCNAHDFKEFSWRHLNFFQHHCYLTADVPRIKCEEHGVRRVIAPWAREGSNFTLLFEQAVMTLVREMPVATTAKLVGITDKRLWRILKHYVTKAMARLDLSTLSTLAYDETSSKKYHNYVTVFVDLDQEDRPVVFATPGKGKECVVQFQRFLRKHGGKAENITEVVCDMSSAFIAGAAENFHNAEVTVDWFHVVQLFTKALEDVRKAEHKLKGLPKGARWAALKAIEKELTDEQQEALFELESKGYATATAYRVKELLRWIKLAETEQGVKWRMSRFIKHVQEEVNNDELLKPVRKALGTFKKHIHRIARGLISGYSNARLEGLNGLFRAARNRARGYRNEENFISMIYLIAAPIHELLEI